MLPADEINTEITRAVTEERRYFEFPHKLANGEIRTVEVYSSPVLIKGTPFLYSIIHDITERKQMENRIKSLLEEKEIILREVHHRIKNNMSAIKGMIELQMDTVEDPKAISALQAAESRIQSMVVLYDKLHMTWYTSELNIRSYFSELVDEIIKLFPNSDSVTVIKDIEDFSLSQDNLFITGIIINELITNIMKYAFPECHGGTIRFCAAIKNKNIVIEISDNGCGLPECFSLNEPKGFGLQVVTMLTEQIGGVIKAESKNGARFTLEIPRVENNFT
jgi:two-component sensor histidine kinase